jgi:hypothetical protein
MEDLPNEVSQEETSEGPFSNAPELFLDVQSVASDDQDGCEDAVSLWCDLTACEGDRSMLQAVAVFGRSGANRDEPKAVSAEAEPRDRFADYEAAGAGTRVATC